MNSQLLQHQYKIAPHVHACRTGSHIVLLDVRRDRYVGLNEGDTRFLRKYVLDWPAQPANDEDASADEDVEMLQHMISEKMLSGSRDGKNSGSRQSIVLPTRTLIDGYAATSPQIGWLDVIRFLTASTIAKALLKWRSLEYVTTRFTSRRLQRAGRRSCSEEWNDFQISHARKQLAVFRRLRPLLFTSADECLFNALALGEYLAHYGLLPQWVFGVATEPFRAHCWLQQGEIVIDDIPGNVNNYTPIMVV